MSVGSSDDILHSGHKIAAWPLGNDVTCVPLSDRSDEQRLRSLQLRLYEIRLEAERKRTCGEQVKSIFTVDYLKQLAPSIVLAVVALLALSASARAQQQINDVNANLVSAQAQVAAAELRMTTSQDQIRALEADVTRLSAQLLAVQGDVTSQLANATAQYQANEARKLAAEADFSSLQAAGIGEIAAIRDEAAMLLRVIREINGSYPYPWQVQTELHQYQTEHRTTVTAAINTTQARLDQMGGSLARLTGALLPATISAYQGGWTAHTLRNAYVDIPGLAVVVPANGTYLALFQWRVTSLSWASDHYPRARLWRTPLNPGASASELVVAFGFPLLGNSGASGANGPEITTTKSLYGVHAAAGDGTATGLWSGMLTKGDTLQLQVFVYSEGTSDQYVVGGDENGKSSVHIIKIDN